MLQLENEPHINRPNNLARLIMLFFTNQTISVQDKLSKERWFILLAGFMSPNILRRSKALKGYSLFKLNQVVFPWTSIVDILSSHVFALVILNTKNKCY